MFIWLDVLRYMLFFPEHLSKWLCELLTMPALAQCLPDRYFMNGLFTERTSLTFSLKMTHWQHINLISEYDISLNCDTCYNMADVNDNVAIDKATFSPNWKTKKNVLVIL